MGNTCQHVPYKSGLKTLFITGPISFQYKSIIVFLQFKTNLIEALDENFMYNILVFIYI